MTSKEIRESFFKFFRTKAHTIVPSAPMVVKNDPTLMFTNAGMNQFKDVFLGNHPSAHPRIADSQKCLRVSGKHNDLEEVGHDTYHHTMFEMLGNWSFGDYFKKEAIEWAWEYLVDVIKLPQNRLYATVFEGSEDDKLGKDLEAFDYWKQFLPEDRILNGSKKDNFWEMGEQGPCGPCSEIHVDLRTEKEREEVDGKTLVNMDHPQVVEIWNLVFIQFNRLADGSLKNLPAKHVDTGMGFERLCMAIQQKTSNYDTDVFQPIIQTISKLSSFEYGKDNQKDIAMRVIADHLRAISFSIADGQLPSNNKAGYVIRRILRRAVRYAFTFLDQKDCFMHKLVPVLIENMGDAFTELKAQQELITKVILEEENSFLKTLDTGIRRLDQIMDKVKADGYDYVNGKEAFELYDTFGFPFDLTELILKENDMQVSKREFDEEMAAQKNRSRNAASMETGDWVVLLDDDKEEFIGYDQTRADVKITRYRKIVQKKKELFQLVFNYTPFYAESGGQVGDTGYIRSANEKVDIINTVKENNLSVHIAKKLPENLTCDFEAVVNEKARQQITNNHTATHLLHHALRTTLGSHVEQKGSLVEAKRLRFDFAHFQKLSQEEIVAVEKMVNAAIRGNVALNEKRDIPMNEAEKLGALSLFGEKYGDLVRVIRFGDSVELCGGTHVEATGNIGSFKIVSESAIAAGIRRIEAITGEQVDEFMYEKIDTLNKLSSLFKNPGDIVKNVETLQTENAKLSKTLDTIAKEQIKMMKSTLKAEKEIVGDINLITTVLKLDSAGDIKDLAFQMKDEIDNLVFVAGAEIDGKANLTIIISKNLVDEKGLNAGAIIRDIAKEIQGGGGGQPFFATAGGKNPAGIEKALEKAREIIHNL